MNPRSEKAWNAFRSAVIAEGGVVLCDGWLGSVKNHPVRCPDGHVSMVRPNNLQQGSPLCVPCTRTSLAERFHSRYDADPVTGCWVWNKGCFSSGYGALWVGRNNRGAHRVGYELIVGPVPEGLELDHLCRNRPCVNPCHLEAVTHQENVLRGEAFNAIANFNDLCVRNHPLVAWNVYVKKNGQRQCKTCHRMRESGQVVAGDWK